MESTPVSKPEMTDYEKINFSTEVAFENLLKQARLMGLSANPVMGLMYLPDQATTVQFQRACRAVLSSLGVNI